MVEETKELNQLIIIGNGFDLNCGLKSQYKDFFEKRYVPTTNKDTYNMVIRSNAAYDLEGFKKHCQNLDMTRWTAWDFIIINILYCQEDSNLGNKWSDFEGLISSLLKDSLPSIGLKSNVYHDLLEILNHEYVDPFDRPDNVNCKNDYTHQPHTIVMYERIAALIWNEYIKKPGWEQICQKIYSPNRVTEFNRSFKTAIDTILLAELRVLERDFAQYINQQVSSSQDYKQNCGNLLFDLLVNDLTLSNLQDGMHNYLLTFNYTQPEMEALRPNYGYRQYWFDYVKNVHGTAKDANDIFGIDYSDGANDDLVRFTKTFRSMQLKETYSGKTFFDHLPINKIKIYGHSLNPADNSYYTSIFDAVGLYSSKTELFFYYKDRDNFDTRAMFLAVNNLIKHYGSTISQDHGSSLLHKLILENRVHIRPLKEYNPMQKDAQLQPYPPITSLETEIRNSTAEKLESISKENKRKEDKLMEMRD
ncbi:bacteriophage abortive infection AbiH family protein [Oenococcus kitaharae]|uniref:bacteriophage abortive infection AbiH family protein n=1 Tax=Oenococcus TaxID=46254 RepID=UPI0021E90E2C|nr:bacteriophage abortive infection AbiH family protein [Oenococcus kitaharae]MCV3296250.1 bacteriophage abortive infection AbiH family protein [Oenococcus kitaharae]